MRRLALTLPLALALLGGVRAVPAVADGGPVVSVTPSTGLARGDTVTVDASGLPPGTAVQVTQCDTFSGDYLNDCMHGPFMTSDGAGRLSTSVTLVDPVHRSQEFGDGLPVYCRADVCRIFLSWTDAAGDLQVASSDPLEFTGAPATITASPSTDLRARQHVRVSGTAYGAEGRTVVVVEEACFDIIQGSGCYGTIVKRSGWVARDGTYALSVKATRYLADGTDCADAANILGHCQLTARILDASGQPDESFGVSSLGDPGALLTFRP
ncbi:MAG: neocarzinostatin apoprotein domain-containing protein [Frankiaceae bacterium]